MLHLKQISITALVALSLAGFSPVAAAAVTNTVVPNELGRIPILEYHQVGPKEDRWTRSFDHFRADLEWLYNNDYRAISIHDFMDQKIAIPAGMKPVIFTFDDGGYTQLNFKDGKVDPYTAIGIMDDFLKVHPDFGSAAVFYVNAKPFKLVEDTKMALQYLLSTGRELGNHTYTHINMSKMDSVGIEKEMGALDRYVRGLGFPDVQLDTIAYPFGAVSKGPGLDAVKKYTKLGLLVGAEPTYPPYMAKYDAMYVPRIQAIDDEWKRWFKRGVGETARSSVGPIFTPYVSDGSSDTLSVVNENGLVRGLVRKGVTIQVGGKSVSLAAPTPTVSLAPQNPEETGFFATLRRWKKGLFNASLEGVQSQAISSEVVPDVKTTPVVKPVVKTVIAPKKKVVELKKKTADVKRTEVGKPAEVKPVEAFPYEKCNDPDASTFINYQKTGRLAPPADSVVSSGGNMPWVDIGTYPSKAVQWVRDALHPNAMRGIYFTGSTAAGETGKKLADKLIASGGNTVVVDVDESSGALSYGNGENKPILRDFSAFVKEMKSRNIYVVARVVAFKDKIITRVKPDLAIQSSGGGMWKDNKGAVWMDPSNPNTVQYVIDMAKSAAAMGVDEVQFDYVRFPTEGDLASTRFKAYPSATSPDKWHVIRDFMKEARKQLIPTGVKLGADIFGIVGWQGGYDAKSTGQKIECLSPYLDVIYPMGYPSHFGPGFGGHKNPADEPYYFTWRTSQYFTDFAKGTGVAIRPWLQAFRYRVTIPYNGKYVSEQMRGAFDAGSDGFILWNASNLYDTFWGVIGK